MRGLRGLEGAPGPKADIDTLNAWARVMGGHFATLNYNRMKATCHWCLMEGEPLPHAEVGVRGGDRKFCSESCAEAREAWMAPRRKSQVKGE